MRFLWTLLAIPLILLALISPANASTARYESKIQLAYQWALTQEGKPYVWGGTGPYGYDCSGLVYAAYKHEGITLPRSTYSMLASRAIYPIPASEAVHGDLAFYGSGHVELAVNTHSETFGAATFGTRLGFHDISGFWHPTAYYRVAGSQEKVLLRS